MEAPTTFQIISTPEETTMIFHIGVTRHVFTDGLPRYVAAEAVEPCHFLCQ